MLAQIFTTAIARFFANAIAGVNAARLMNRSGKLESRASGAGRGHAAERPLKVQLWVVRGVSSDLGESASAMPSQAMHFDAPAGADDPLATEIETHREVIALYRDKATGPDMQLSVFARDILPHLQQHLAMLESLQSENRHARR